MFRMMISPFASWFSIFYLFNHIIAIFIKVLFHLHFYIIIFKCGSMYVLKIRVAYYVIMHILFYFSFGQFTFMNLCILLNCFFGNICMQEVLLVGQT